MRIGIEGTAQGNVATMMNRGERRLFSSDEVWVLTFSNGRITGQLSAELNDGVPEFCTIDLIM